MREWNGRYRHDQWGGLPGSSDEREGGVVVDVVDHRGISSGLGVYRREEEEETINIMQTDATQMHDVGNTQG